jgi:hypothetical protein
LDCEQLFYGFPMHYCQHKTLGRGNIVFSSLCDLLLCVDLKNRICYSVYHTQGMYRGHICLRCNYKRDEKVKCLICNMYLNFI